MIAGRSRSLFAFVARAVATAGLFGTAAGRRARTRMQVAMLLCVTWLAGAVPSAIASPSGTSQAEPHSELQSEPHIAMVLWRGETEVEQGFRAALADYGIHARIEVHDVARDLQRLPAIIEQLRADPPDVVYTWGTGVTLGVAGRWDDEQTPLGAIPVVFTMVASPYKTGIAAPHEAPPRPWVTGVSHLAPLAAQINAMRSYLPVSRVGVVFNPLEANSVSNVEELHAHGRRMQFEVLEAPVPAGADAAPDPAAIPALVAGLAERGAQVLYIGPDNFVGNHRDALTSAGMAHGVPAFTATELELRDGEAMFGLVSRYETVGRFTAAKVRDILVNGKRPDEIPVETLERFAYLIRLGVARQLGLYPPLPLLRYAEVIE